MSKVFFKKPELKLLKDRSLTAVDMHFHTEYSMDAISKLNNVIKKAKKLNIGVAITDHNNTKGAIKAYKNKKKVMIIPGIEVSCKRGIHTLFYFYTIREIQEFYRKEIKPRMEQNPFFISIYTENLIEISKKYNCIVCSPHPFAPGITGIHKIKISKNTLKNIDLIEVLNGYNLRNLNLKALKWARLCKRGYTGGTDGHTTFELGNTLTYAEGSTIESFIKSLLKGKSTVMGTEENIFEKAVFAVSKEETYLKKAHEHKKSLLLIESQYKTEADYLKKCIKKDKKEILRWLKIHHL